MDTRLGDAYINYIIKHQIQVTIAINMGASIKLTGFIAGADDENYFLSRDGITQKILRSEGVTINPMVAFSLEDLED